jgi:hypothetical protein
VVVIAPPAAAWEVTPAGVGGLFFSGALATFFNYLAMAWVNKRASPVIVSAAYPLQSFFTPLLSTLILGSEVYATDFAGGAVVILGLALCIRAQMLEEGGGGGGGGGGSASIGGGEAAKASPPSDAYEALLLEEAERGGASGGAGALPAERIG